jgi:ParB/RepB/Spo0J family partition protein
MSTIADAIKSTGEDLRKQLLDSRGTHEEMHKKIMYLKAHINKVIMVRPSEIQLEKNVRSRIDEDSQEIQKLCESINKFGLMKNIVAELRFSKNEDSYELICIAGHRRLTALKKMGKMSEHIPCLIKTYDKAHQGDKIGAALSENLIREGLGCVDIADGYQALKNTGWSSDDLIKHFERNKKTTAQYLRLAELPNDIKDTIRNHSERLTTRVVFNEILAKNKTPGDIRKAITRKLEIKKPGIPHKQQAKIKEKLNAFFEERNATENEKQFVFEALKYVGTLK